MNDLITASLNHQDGAFLFKLPDQLVRHHEKEWLAFIRKYQQKFNQMPTLERLRKQFPDFVPIPADEPVGDIFEQVFNARLSLFLTQIGNGLTDGTLQEKKELLAQAHELAAMPLSATDTLDTYDINNVISGGKLWDLPLYNIQHGIGGIGAGELCYLFAEPAAGKSTILLWFALHWLKQGAIVQFHSTEMETRYVFLKIYGMLAGFDPLIVRQAQGKDVLAPYKERIKEGIKSLSGKLIVPNQHLFKPAEIASEARRNKADIVIVDGVYKLLPDGGTAKGSSDWVSLTQVSNALNRDALSLGIPYLLSTQANRQGEVARTLAFLQDATFLMYLEKTGVAERKLSLHKARTGGQADDYIDIDFSTSTFKVFGNADY